MPRLFTGIEIPGEITRRIAGLRGGLPGARWVEPDNYHITLRFLGDVGDATAHDAADLLGRVQRRAFALELDGIGAFGGKRPRSIWAGVRITPELMALQAEHEQLMQQAGLAPEGRNYAPHVTLARLKGVKSSAVATYLESRGGFYAGPIPITRFVLFSAKPSRGGGPYLVERAYPLAQGPEVG